MTTAAMLFEIGGVHAVNGPRNLSEVVGVFAGMCGPTFSRRVAVNGEAGKPHTMRDMLTWLFWTCSNIQGMAYNSILNSIVSECCRVTL